jgi:hypothetical protein
MSRVGLRAAFTICQYCSPVPAPVAPPSCAGPRYSRVMSKQPQAELPRRPLCVQSGDVVMIVRPSAPSYSEEYQLAVALARTYGRPMPYASAEQDTGERGTAAGKSAP